ncbi:PLC-like phosphodiesterase [Zychaea mexicana]|uniref:PLC-like phosphodiesterase n=1 Tax=Zychaea mexicana TaxID=64656 RepID=UPI0022FE4FF9|nr:PLC-like phosphodiesterase [Zychaea mexicana]KAI9488926.1 PLC-like phosphodiesterase [Zychaea mexicana]
MLNRLFFQGVAAAASLLALGVSAQDQQACNGYAEFCSRPYSDLTYVLTHNSYAYMANPAANQQCDISAQLTDGVRALRLSAVKPDNSSDIHLCHTSCSFLDDGPAQDTLSTLATWLKDNPNEVLTVMWNVPNQDFWASDFQAPYEASGILEYAHVQEQQNLTWPTLQDLITSGKRLINFVDVNADQNSVPWLHSQYDYVFETPYDNKNESSFTCTIDRPENPVNPQQMMYGMNHFLYGSLPWGDNVIQIPQSGSASVTNSHDSLMLQANECNQAFGARPNFLIVDFYNRGQTLEIAAELNNVTYDSSKELVCDKSSTNTGSDNSDSAASSLQIFISSPFIATLLLVGLVMTFIPIHCGARIHVMKDRDKATTIWAIRPPSSSGRRADHP